MRFETATRPLLPARGVRCRSRTHGSTPEAGWSTTSAGERRIPIRPGPRSCAMGFAAPGARMRTALLAAGLAAAAACGIPGEGPAMRPGEDCLSCHNGDIARAWSVAGTVYSDPNAPILAGETGAQVIVTDANQRVLTLTTNEAGNFYTAEALAAPLSVKIQRGTFRMEMAEAPASGSCNSCHAIPVGDPDAPGRLFVPYQKLSRKP